MGLVECVIGMNRDVRQSMLEQRQQLSKNQQHVVPNKIVQHLGYAGLG